MNKKKYTVFAFGVELAIHCFVLLVLAAFNNTVFQYNSILRITEVVLLLLFTTAFQGYSKELYNLCTSFTFSLLIFSTVLQFSVFEILSLTEHVFNNSIKERVFVWGQYFSSGVYLGFLSQIGLILGYVLFFIRLVKRYKMNARKLLFIIPFVFTNCCFEP